jgi:hypothetical protein
MSQDLASLAVTLVADGKGILAADESVATLTRRLTRSGSSQPKPDPMVTSENSCGLTSHGEGSDTRSCRTSGKAHMLAKGGFRMTFKSSGNVWCLS